MKNRTPILLLALVGAALTAAAQDPTPVPPATRDAASVVLAPKSASPAPAPIADSDGVARPVSPGIAQALADGMPKYSPPTPEPVQPAESQDARDLDKPKNEIPRLPAYVVRASRPPIFRPRDLNTSAGLIDLAFRNHPGLAIGNILGLNEALARDMFYEDERLTNIGDLADTAHAMAAGGDKDEAKYILQETQDTYMRTPDTTWGGPGGGGGFSGGGGK
jgi:hypothetical protein